MTQSVQTNTVPYYQSASHGVAVQGLDALDGSRHAWLTVIAYLAALVAAELIVALGSPIAGLIVHVVIIGALAVHAASADPRLQGMLFALTLAPLVRVVSLAMPIAGLSLVQSLALTSFPLFISAAIAARQLGFLPSQLGLRAGNVPWQLAIGLIGIPLGAAEYLVLRPTGMVTEASWQSLILPILVLLVCTGFLEELIFRGILQTTARRSLGRWSGLYVNATFAALHIGYLSVLDVIFVFLAGYLFSWVVYRTGSLLGVTLAHGITNVGLLVVFPLLSANAPSDLHPTLRSILVPETEVASTVARSGTPAETPALESATPLASVQTDIVAAEAPTVASGPSIGFQPAVVVGSDQARLPDTTATVDGHVSLGPRIQSKEDLETVAPESAGADLLPAVGLNTTTSSAEPAPPSEQPGVTLESWDSYTVQRGDTLYFIATRRGTTVDSLVVRNDIRNPNLIYAGDEFLVPRPDMGE